MIGLLESEKASVESLQSVLGTQLSVYDQIKDVSTELAAMEAARGNTLMETISTDYAKQQFMAAQAKLQQEMVNMGPEELVAAKQKNKELQDSIDLMQQQVDLVAYQIQARDAMTDAVVSPFTSMKSAVESIPGIGGGLSKLMGLDVFNKQMGDIVGKSIQVGMADGIGAGISNFKALTAQTKIFGISLKAALWPLIGVAAIVGAIMLFKKMQDTTMEISKNTGQSALQSEKMAQAARDLQTSQANTLSTTDEIVASMSALKEEFGSTNNFSGETALNIANMSTAFGIAVNDAAAVQRQFEAMGQSSEEAFQTQALAANLSEAAGVAPGKVMKDIATNSKKAAKYLGGNAKALAKAAVEAARLGMELGDMVDIADGLLDIESSIEAEFEASVMLGKRINMDLARQLALQGDIEGATKAVLDQVGSIHDFNKMDVLQRKKIAQAAGMEVGALQDALQKQEQLNNMTAAQKKRYDEATKALEGATLSPEDVVRQQEQALAAKEMSAAFDNIKNTLMKTLYPIVKKITQVFTDVLAPILDIIGAAFSGMMIALTPVFALLKAMGAILKTFAPILKPIATIFGAIYMYKLLMNNLDKIEMGWLKTKAFFGSKSAKTKLAEIASQTTKNSLEGVETNQLMIQQQMMNNMMLMEQRMLGQQGMMNVAKTTELGTETTMNAKKKLGSAIDTKDLGQQGLMNAAKVTELGTEGAINTTKKTGIMLTLKETAQQAFLAIKKAAVWTWEMMTNSEKRIAFALTLKETVQQGLLAVAKGAVWLWQTMTSVAATATAAATGTQAAASTAAIAPTAALATTHGAAATAAMTTASASTLGVGIAPILAAVGIGVAALFALMAGASALMSDGVIGPSGGKGGFGSRVMFGPEGAISFNNKDTIVAGTDLFKANDAAFGPPGSMSMADQGPQEIELKDIQKKAFKKLVMANMVGSSPMGMLMGGIGALAGGIGGMFGGGDEEEEGGSPVYDETNATKMDAMLAKLDQLITATAGGKGGTANQGPVQIVIGNKVIEEIAGMMNVNKSYTIGAGNAGEEG